MSNNTPLNYSIINVPARHGNPEHVILAEIYIEPNVTGYEKEGEGWKSVAAFDTWEAALEAGKKLSKEKNIPFK